MKIVCAADTHLYHAAGEAWNPPIPYGDVFILAGDGMSTGSIAEMWQYSEWLESLPHPNKIIIAGNHDLIFEGNPNLALSMLPKGVIYLQDQMVEVGGLRIYGSPWTPRFFNWAFNLDRGYPLAAVWRRIPEGIDILVTHGPPQGILDLTYRRDRAGCEELRSAVERVQPRVHVFGHIHSAHGIARYGKTLFINASIVDDSYRPVWAPYEIDLDPLERPDKGLVDI